MERAQWLELLAYANSSHTKFRAAFNDKYTAHAQPPFWFRESINDSNSLGRRGIENDRTTTSERHSHTLLGHATDSCPECILLHYSTRVTCNEHCIGSVVEHVRDTVKTRSDTTRVTCNEQCNTKLRAHATTAG